MSLLYKKRRNSLSELGSPKVCELSLTTGTSTVLPYGSSKRVGRVDGSITYSIRFFASIVENVGNLENGALVREATNLGECTRRILTKLTKPLREGKNRINGRNNQGRITIRRRGGGHKRNYRKISFQNHRLETEYMVYDLVYDPNRTAQLAVLGPVSQRDPSFVSKGLDGGGTLTEGVMAAEKLLTSQDFLYILAPKGVVPGDIIHNWKIANEKSLLKGLISSTQDLDMDSLQIRPSLGDSLPLWKIALGSLIHNIEVNPGQGGRYVRAGGGYAQVLDKSISKSSVLLRLPSGEKKWFPFTARASMGVVSSRLPISNATDLRAGSTTVGEGGGSQKRNLGKAGRNRWLGRRPKVRGVAMNPVDHPHGGGEGRTSGGRPSVTPWGRPTKGGKTRSPSKNKRRPLLKLLNLTVPKGPPHRREQVLNILYFLRLGKCIT